MTITASAVRYIKLGRGGRWEEISFRNGELHFGVSEAPHDLVLGGDRDKVRQHSIAAGRHPRSAAEDVREIFDFYFLGSDCLWVTFARDHMWWTFADPLYTQITTAAALVATASENAQMNGGISTSRASCCGPIL
jgi:hypothetical protein